MHNKNSRINEALSLQSKYCYSNSNVLKNKLGIKDEKELEAIEKNLTTLMLMDLQMKSIPRANVLFSIDYLLSLHKYVFGNLYSFSGKIRDENIVKGNTPFCRPEFIYNYLSMLIEKMKDDIKKLKSKDDVINFLAFYYSELNIIHPFREGNGRIIREYLRQIVVFINNCLDFDCELDFSNITEEDKNNLINGSKVSAMSGNLDLLYKFFSNTLKEKEVIKEHQK